MSDKFSWGTTKYNYSLFIPVQLLSNRVIAGVLLSTVILDNLRSTTVYFIRVDNHGWTFEKEDRGKGKEDEEIVGSELGELNKTATLGHIRSPNIQFQIEYVSVHVL